jgi:hypothetical protein
MLLMISRGEDMTSLADYFEYLDRLRESGRTNMYGATHYLMDCFQIEMSEARSILRKWQSTYDPNKSPNDRVEEAR